MPSVFVVHGSAAYTAMFNHLGWDVVEDMAEADLVQFTGGEDVNPAIYGEKPHHTTHFNVDRDRHETMMYVLARDNGIPMAGICRGGQFLNVMNGGRMWQHVSGHAISGTHEISSVMLGKGIFVTSTHHQMMIAGRGGHVEAVAHGLSPVRYRMGGDESVGVRDDTPEVEVVWYEDTKCLCFQPHPEHYGAHSTRAYYEALLNKYILEA